MIIVDTIDTENRGTYEFSMTASVTPSNIQASTTFELKLDTLTDEGGNLTPYFETTEGFSP